jgi:rod shape-determining protein MreD
LGTTRIFGFPAARRHLLRRLTTLTHRGHCHRHHHPFGIFGIAKGLIGYCAASIGFAIDAENPINRTVMVFAFSLLQSGLLYAIQHWLLGDHTYALLPLRQLIAAVANSVVALPLFFMLDRFRIRE